MARTDAGETPTEKQARDNNTDKLLERRSYLKLAGSALAASGFLTTTAQQTSAQATTISINDGDAIDPHLENISDGDVIEIPQGNYTFNGATISANNWEVIGNGSTFDVQGNTQLNPRGSNWTFRGVELQVESGNVRCLPRGSGWTLKNISWSGPNTQGSPLVRPYIPSGAEATIENCWFGDGMGTRVGESAIKANSDGNGSYSINGDLHVKGCYFFQNTCYAAASAGAGQPGRVHFDSCYFQDAYLAAMRTGSVNGACNVTNCVITLEDMNNVPETSSGASATRGVWAYWGEVVVENTDIHLPGNSALLASSSKGNAQITARDCEVTGRIGSGVTQSNIGNNPSRSPPEGCVTSREDAYLGQTSSSDTTGSENTGSGSNDTESVTGDYPNTLSISGDQGTTVVNYEFEVTEQARKSTARNASIDDEDQISEKTVTGAVAGGTDSYEFGGKISSFTIDGDATIYLNGSEVSADSLATASTTDPSSEQYEGQLIIDGTDHPNQMSTYEIKVDGDVAKSSELGTINSFDSIENGVITGRVINGKDAYTFTGDIIGFKINGAATFNYKDSA